MAKTQSRFVCQECGRVSIRPLGRCPSCGGWDTMVEELITPIQRTTTHTRTASVMSAPLKLDDVSGKFEERWVLGMNEFSRVLGGGIVPGSIVLLG